MSKESKKPIYRVTFLTSQDTVCELYVNHLVESSIFGFIEIGEFVFGENTSLVVDPSEERLKAEFGDVRRSYIPSHEILRIDEVEKSGKAKFKPLTEGNKISPFPTPGFKRIQPADKESD